MIWPQPISLCTSTIESAVYENRTYSAVRGRRLVTASYSIVLERKEGDRHWNERKATDIGTKEGDRHIGTKKGGKHIGKERKNRRFRDFSKKKKKNVDKIIRHIVIYRSCLENRREHNCGCSSMVECQPSKLNTWVRFPSPAFLPR